MSWPRALLWLLLATPAVLMAHGLATGTAQPIALYHPTGELSLRLMLLALLAGPVAEFFGAGTFTRGWLAIRRNLGVAGCAYGLLHLAIYILDMAALAPMLEELALPAIWTGWLALAALLVPAAISTDAAMRALGRRWKALQRLAYPAFALALIHWALLDRAFGPALVHLAPLLIAWVLRLLARRGIRYHRST